MDVQKRATVHGGRGATEGLLCTVGYCRNTTRRRAHLHEKDFHQAHNSLKGAKHTEYQPPPHNREATSVPHGTASAHKAATSSAIRATTRRKVAPRA